MIACILVRFDIMERGSLVGLSYVSSRLVVACRSLVLRSQMVGRSWLESLLLFFILHKRRKLSGCFLLHEMRRGLEYMEIWTSFMMRSFRLNRMEGYRSRMVNRSRDTLMDWHRVVQGSGMFRRLLMVNSMRGLWLLALMNRCLVVDLGWMLNRMNGSMMRLYLMLSWCNNLMHWNFMLNRMDGSMWCFALQRNFSVMLNLLMINTWGFMMNRSDMRGLFFDVNWLRMSLLLEMSDRQRAMI